MSFIFTDEGREALFEGLLKDTNTPNAQALKLFSNNIAITKDITLTDLTELSGNGYSEITLARADWTISTGTTNLTIAQQSSKTFNFSTGSVINAYGQYIVLTLGSTEYLLGVERFTTPKAISSSADDFSLLIDFRW